MKAQINKSKLMKRAWTIFKGNNPYSDSFSESLRRAWFVEKEALAYAERKAAEAVKEIRRTDFRGSKGESFIAGCLEYYNNDNRYYGD